MQRTTIKRLIDIVWIGAIVLILLGLACGGHETLPLYISSGDLFASWFTEPIEKAIFIAYNGKHYAFTNQVEDFVVIPLEELTKALKKDGIEIKDLMCVIHNHVGSRPKFSLDDLRYYTYMRERGFNGWFLLWSSPRQRVTDWIPPRKE